jgi:hypothetical protein
MISTNNYLSKQTKSKFDILIELCLVKNSRFCFERNKSIHKEQKFKEKRENLFFLVFQSNLPKQMKIKE